MHPAKTETSGLIKPWLSIQCKTKPLVKLHGWEAGSEIGMLRMSKGQLSCAHLSFFIIWSYAYPVYTCAKHNLYVHYSMSIPLPCSVRLYMYTIILVINKLAFWEDKDYPQHLPSIISLYSMMFGISGPKIHISLTCPKNHLYI